MFGQLTVIDTVRNQKLIPKKILEKIREDWDYGNDVAYVYPENLGEEVLEWVKDKLQLDPEKVLIHYWW